MPAVLAAGAMLYLGVLWALMGLPRQGVTSQVGATLTGPWSHLVAGFRVARETPRLTAALCNTIIFNLFCWPVLSMVPVIGQERLRLSTEGVGMLASMDGLGSLIGASLLMSLVHRFRHGLVYMGGTFLFLVLLPVFALSTHPLLSAAALIGIGVGQGAFAVMQATLAYLSVPQERRPEAMGLMTTCIGIAPLGFLQVGWMAEQLGASGAAVVSSAAGLVALGLTWRVWRPCLRDDSAILRT
jgi:predicted MFS family arabinose efflux permease